MYRRSTPPFYTPPPTENAALFPTRRVPVPKYRHGVFTGTHLARMEQAMRDVCADFKVEPREFNRGTNHVHLPVNFSPKVALSRLVNSLKGVIPRRMRQEFPEPARHYYRANRLWNVGYLARFAQKFT